MTQETLGQLFGWMPLFNLPIYALSAAMVVFARDWLIRVQSRMLGMENADWTQLYVEWLGRYKLMILVFNLVPWLGFHLL